ncbi:hypothetical protein ACSBR2_031240 [Camellia fascicularis]
MLFQFIVLFGFGDLKSCIHSLLTSLCIVICMSSWNDHPGNKQMQRQRSLPKLASDHSSYSGGTTKEDLFSCELWSKLF